MSKPTRSHVFHRAFAMKPYPPCVESGQMVAPHQIEGHSKAGALRRTLPHSAEPSHRPAPSSAHPSNKSKQPIGQRSASPSAASCGVRIAATGADVWTADEYCTWSVARFRSLLLDCDFSHPRTGIAESDLPFGCLRPVGSYCSFHRIHISPASDEGNWMRNLPRPCGVFFCPLHELTHMATRPTA